MALEAVMIIEPTSFTEATVTCPCRQVFSVDSITELNLVFDPAWRLLRAVCPRCSRVEMATAWDFSHALGGSYPPANRITPLFSDEQIVE